MAQVLILREREVRELIDPAAAIDAARAAFVALWRGQVEQPPVVSLDLRERRGEIHVKAAYVHGAPRYVVKVASGFYAILVRDGARAGIIPIAARGHQTTAAPPR